MGFRLRLVELGARRGERRPPARPLGAARGSTTSGIALDEDGYETVLERAADLGLKIQDHPGKRTFVATEAGYRLEVHPPREWIEDALAEAEELRLAELHLRARRSRGEGGRARRDPRLRPRRCKRVVGDTLVRFLPGRARGPARARRRGARLTSYERRASRWPRPRRSSSGCARRSSRRERRRRWAVRRLRGPLRARRRAAARGDDRRGRHEAHPLAPRRAPLRRRRRPRRPLRQRRHHHRRRAALLPRLRRLGRRSTSAEVAELVEGAASVCRDGRLRDPRRRDRRAARHLPRGRARLRGNVRRARASERS